ncbi:MAG: hypothetical protein IT317_01285 [Anaerolineales bacterium]|nr:hypothetical protein [Anaerolineales bacterium]
MEIEIRPGTFTMVLAVSAIFLLTLLGYQSSPRDEAGRPVLLLPDVRAVELYRRSAVGWANEWKSMSADLEQILSDADVQLLTRSRQAQRVFDRAVALAQEVDGTEAPSALLGLHEQAASNSNAQIEASAAIARWLSAPTDENRAAADAALANANAALAVLEANDWIAPASEVNTP